MEFVKNNIKIEIQKKPLSDKVIQTYLEYSDAKIIFKWNNNLSYKHLNYEKMQLKREFPGQTYITIPFSYSFNQHGNINFSLNDKDGFYDGECKVSKRIIKTAYSMFRANKEEVLHKSKDAAQYALNKLANMLNGNIFEVAVTDLMANEEKYKFSNLVTDEVSFYDTVVADMMPIDLETREAMQALIANGDFQKMFNNCSPIHFFTENQL